MISNEKTVLQATAKLIVFGLQLWRYGKGDACEEEYGRDFVTVGCSAVGDESTGMTTMEKWVVDVQCQGCRGLFYRSAPNVIVTDADWPRNGDVVMGYEIPNTPGKLMKFASCDMRFDSLYSKCYLSIYGYDEKRLDKTAKWLLFTHA